MSFKPKPGAPDSDYEFRSYKKTSESAHKSTDNKISLRYIALFNGIDDMALQSFTRYLTLKIFLKGATLIQEGEYSDPMYIILSGSVEFYTNDSNGKEAVLNSLGPSNCLGGLALLGGRPRSVSARTMSQCKMLILTRAAFITAVKSYPEVGLELLAALSGKLREHPKFSTKNYLRKTYSDFA